MDKINDLFFCNISLLEFEVLLLLYHDKTEQALLGRILLGITMDVDKKAEI